MTPAGDPASVVGVGLAVLLVLGTGMWKAASLRGDLNRTWSKRVDAATAALTDRAIDELRALRAETDRRLGDEDDPNPPLLAAADPAPLIVRAEAVARFNRTGQRLRSHLDRLLLIAPYIVPVLVIAALGTVALTLFYAEIIDRRWVRVVGLIASALGFVLLVLLFGTYLSAQHRLSGAEILVERPHAEEEQGPGWDFG